MGEISEARMIRSRSGPAVGPFQSVKPSDVPRWECVSELVDQPFHSMLVHGANSGELVSRCRQVHTFLFLDGT